MVGFKGARKLCRPHPMGEGRSSGTSAPDMQYGLPERQVGAVVKGVVGKSENLGSNPAKSPLAV